MRKSIVKNVPKALTHRLDVPPYIQYKTLIDYGKCQVSPHSDLGLWFVNIKTSTRDEHTYLVKETYAHPSYMDKFGTELENWKKIAYKEFVGSWCIYYECLWKDIPIFEYTLSDGTTAKYGYSRMQLDENHYLHEKYPNRELWFVVIKNQDINRHESFIVDREAVEIDFIEKMGSDPERWKMICWSWVAPPQTAKEMATRKFELDSPYKPQKISDIYDFLEKNEGYR